MSYVRSRQLLLTIKNYMETTFNDYSWQGNRGAVGKQGLSGEPGAQVRQDSDFYLTRRISHFWLGRVLLSINRSVILLQGQIGPRGENGEYGLTGEMVSSRQIVPCTFLGCSPYFIKNVFQALQIDPLRLYYCCTSHWFVTSFHIRHGKTCILFCNTAAKRIEKRYCAFYLSWINPVLQQIRLLQVASMLTSDWIELYGGHAIHGSCKTSLPWAGKTRDLYKFWCIK